MKRGKKGVRNELEINAFDTMSLPFHVNAMDPEIEIQLMNKGVSTFMPFGGLERDKLLEFHERVPGRKE